MDLARGLPERGLERSRFHAVRDLLLTVPEPAQPLVATLVRLSTFLLTIGVARSLLAAGNPAEARPARETLLYAAIGYTLALLVHLW